MSAPLINRRVLFARKQDARFVEEPVEERALREREILGKTVVSLISTGSERGGYMDYNDNMAYPQVTGYAAVLEVVDTGSAVTRVKKGDLFYASTPHALYSQVSEEEILPVPSGLAPERAVFCRFPAVSMSSIIPMTVRPTEPVLVTGLGLVGLMCSQVLQNFGYDVYAVDPVQKRRDYAKKCGILHPVAEIADVPGMAGKFGAAFDCSGDETGIYACADSLRQGGELFLVGVPWRKTTSMDGHGLLLKIFYGFLHVHSGWEWNLPRKSGPFLPDSHDHSLNKSLQWIAEGKLQVDGIALVRDPADCGEVYREIGDNVLQNEASCVLFDWRSY
ncbi:threonine dehydrogenase-like Zn-dependent dehydrogenase [Paenibacillus rhizosphaerae]|uniref:Threonine dehydrogenase-like Zn-dependent dehydrogenase n=1 Tax=Paenibacillus rhizosphaerae TaxID=297318 RepID=A0A839TP20_9BACL|nr:zinc-binding alcohol dehydrogenase [Paenibacillus rhizosphaerae]MBB3128432.1 threonine dehydrogenase-like Zn-dependent dehydrogenase [Paenibacillus rhizosphaerae]